MPRFYGHLQKLKIPEQKFTQTFEAAAQVLVRQGAREFVREAIIHVPVWTGMARGSIKFATGPGGNLARYLNVAVPIDPKSDKPKWYYHNGIRVLKTPESGGLFSYYNFTSGNHRYGFMFRSDVIHYIVNDFYSSVSPTSPWFSMTYASSAFHNYISANVKTKLPKVQSFIVKLTVPFGE